MMRRRGAVHGDRESDDIEVGLDELLGTRDSGVREDAGADEPIPQDEAYPEDEAYREGEPRVPGASLGAAFFGWLVACGTAVLLLALVGAVCTLIGWDRLAAWAGDETSTGRLYVGGWIVFVLSMGVAAFAGGYAGGRMVPSHGDRQGLGVWLFGWAAAGLILGLGYLVDRKYDVVERIDWPSVPVAEADRPWATLAALIAILLITLLGSVLGGTAGNNCYGRLTLLRKG
ncbi:hypothetical protein ACIBL3_29735 [Kribbella sp. NPDC050124]|uniref:hypothetical protein n=1 Tax=Kribbella sp. NPDC050124 TaxID=3364114 RepID=UPI003789D990